MISDQASGAFVPADVVALAAPMCDWTERDKAYQKMIDAAKKAAKASAAENSGQ
jgi:hypothetical protein